MAFYNPYSYMTPYQGYQSPTTVPSTVPTPVPTQPPQNNNGLIWVQGESGAKSYMVAPNTTVMLMDSEASRFYLKSSDASGFPMPIRVFEYEELKPNTASVEEQAKADTKSSFVTKSEFEAFKDKIEHSLSNSAKKKEAAKDE